MTTYTHRRSGVIHRDPRCGYLERSNLADPTRWDQTTESPPLYAPGEMFDERCQQCFSPTFRPPP